MKRDKKQQHHIHTHHTGGGGGGGHHSPPYSPDAANATSQHFFPADSGTSWGSGGSGGTHKTSTTTAPSTTMTVSELLRSFGPSAYLSHDLLLGVATVLALFFHTALHHLLYTLNWHYMNGWMYVASLVTLLYVLAARVFHQHVPLPPTPEENHRNISFEDTLLLQAKQWLFQQRYLLIANIITLLCCLASSKSMVYVTDFTAICNWAILFVILNGYVIHEYLQHQKDQSLKKTHVSMNAHMLSHMDSVVEEDVQNSLSTSHNPATKNVINASESLQTFYVFLMKPVLDAICLLYVIVLAPWIGTRMYAPSYLIYVAEDFVTLSVLACLIISLLLIIHHIQRHRVAFILFLKHFSHTLNNDDKKQEIPQLAQILVLPIITFFMKWLDRETTAVSFYGQQISPSTLTVLLMLLISSMLQTIMIMNSPSDRLVVVLLFGMIITALCFVALLLALVSDAKHQIKATTSMNKDQKTKHFSKLCDVDTLNQKYALLHNYFEQYEKSTINAPEVIKLLDNEKVEDVIDSPVVYKNNKKAEQPSKSRPKMQHSNSSQANNSIDRKKDSIRRNSK